jgi:hypothetical protein
MCATLGYVIHRFFFISEIPFMSFQAYGYLMKNRHDNYCLSDIMVDSKMNGKVVAFKGGQK